MAHRLRNTSSVPLDIATLNGPAILPAGGEITVELSAFEIEVMHHSPDIEIVATDAVAGTAKTTRKKVRNAAKKDVDPDVLRLRKDYLDLVGKKPFGGWDSTELQKRIDAKLVG